MKNWRLILDGAAAGAWNMAVDEALLLAHGAGMVPPTLRFYDWQPAGISLGRFQKTSTLPDSSAFPFVRRPTGGRAVLHQHEITYCAVVREDLLPPDGHSVLGAYRWLSHGLVLGLQELGIGAILARPENPGHRPVAALANCFSSVARCDFLVDNRKLIGAAQCRKGGAVLQHGSLLLDIDHVSWRAALGGSMNATISLCDLGIKQSRTEILQVLQSGVERALGVTLVEGMLSREETSLVQRLHNDKYTQPAWNDEAREPVANWLEPV